MGKRIELLDHGYVEFIESWGSDERIIESARMSTNKGFQGWGQSFHVEDCPQVSRTGLNVALKASCPDCGNAPGDEKLLKFLWDNKHATPFEMAGMIIEVQAPIFVFREWHRHRTQSYNELSARYTPIPDVNYVPSVERLMINAGSSNKQAGTVAGSAQLDEVAAIAFRRKLKARYATLETDYQLALQDGVPKELARIIIPVGRYSRMRASATLRNWLAFITLRSAPNAQWEIQQYSNAVGEFIKDSFPRTWDLFSAK